MLRVWQPFTTGEVSLSRYHRPSLDPDNAECDRHYSGSCGLLLQEKAIAILETSR